MDSGERLDKVDNYASPPTGEKGILRTLSQLERMLRQKIDEEEARRAAPGGAAREAGDDAFEAAGAARSATDVAARPDQAASAGRQVDGEQSPATAARPPGLPDSRPVAPADSPPAAGPAQVEVLADRRAERRLTARLGQLLLDHHLISKRDLAKALEQQRESNERLGHYLVRQGLIEESDLLRLLSDQYGVPAAELDALDVPGNVLEAVPAAMARRYRLVPLKRSNGALDVAMVDPSDVVAVSNLRFATGLRINVLVAAEDSLERAIDRLYGASSTRSLTASGHSEEHDRSETEIEERADAPPAAEANTAFDRVKKMLIERERHIVAALQDPRQTYELVLEMDGFVHDVLREARRKP